MQIYSKLNLNFDPFAFKAIIYTFKYPFIAIFIYVYFLKFVQMDNHFEIPVTYKGEDRDLKSRLIMTGYMHKFEVEVDGTLVLFEPDDEQNYRALVDEATLQRNPKLDVGLLQAIAEVIESLRK